MCVKCLEQGLCLVSSNSVLCYSWAYAQEVSIVLID